jgi:hypothetical protein
MTLSVVGTQILAAVVALATLLAALTALVNQIRSALQDLRDELSHNTAKLSEVHVMVNSNLTSALGEVARMHSVIESATVAPPPTAAITPLTAASPVS